MQPLASFPPILERLRAVLPPQAEMHVVGGTVRDALRGRAVHDIDLAAPRDTLRWARRLADALGGAFYPLDAARGTGRVLLDQHGERLVIDLAAYRGATLEDDLRARDFTINALAVPLHAPDRLIDPTGGLQDLKDKVLRACSPRAFTDDPLRVLRGVRLAAELNFRIVPATRDWMRQAIPLLEDVSPERLRDEVFRMVETPHPAAPFKALDALGALPYVLPEAARLHGAALPPPHTADAWTHTMRTVDALAGLLAALHPLYDQERAADFALGFAMVRIGRYREHLAEHFAAGVHTERPLRALLFLAAFFVYGEIPPPDTLETPAAARTAARWGRALRLSAAEIRRLETIVRYHRWPAAMSRDAQPPSPREIHRYFRRTGAAGVEIVLLSLAQVMAAYGPRLPHDLWRAHLETARALWSAWWDAHETIVDPPRLINGRDLMAALGMRPGPHLGQLLEALREAQAAGEVATREEAVAWAARWLEARV